MVQGSLNENISFLGERLLPVAWNPKSTSVVLGKKTKNANKQRKILISKKCSFSKYHSPQNLGS